jgi:hypothetical protein
MLYFKYIFPWPYLWWSADEPPKSFIATPLPSLTVMFFLAGVMSIFVGILAEMIMRTYYESQAKTTYLLREDRDEPEAEPAQTMSHANASEPATQAGPPRS